MNISTNFFGFFVFQIRHITNLCRKGLNEESLSGDVGQACELAPANPETVKFVCDLQRKQILFCRSNPVLFQQMIGFDGLPKLVVRKVTYSGQKFKRFPDF